MDLKDVITLVLATVGAVLGVLNAWRNWQLDRVRLRVRAVQSIGLPAGRAFAGVEVTNLSNFAVTVEEIGFGAGRGDATLQQRLAIVTPIIASGHAMPVRLESRTAFTGHAAAGAGQPGGGGLTAYARTAFGVPVWDRRRREAAAAAEHPPG